MLVIVVVVNGNHGMQEMRAYLEIASSQAEALSQLFAAQMVAAEGLGSI